MKFGLVLHCSKKTQNLKAFVDEIEKQIETGVHDLDISDTLTQIVIGVNLSEFEPSDKLVTRFKNYTEEKAFEFTLNLKIEKYLESSLEVFRSHFFEDFKLGVLEVFEKKFKNKNLGVLITSYAQKALFGRSDQNIDTLLAELDKIPTKTSKQNFKPKHVELDESLFWDLIENAFIPGNTFKKNVLNLEKILSEKRDEVIIGFQITLRKLMQHLASEPILEKAKDANGYVSDDSFIYLRCKLISLGNETYMRLIADPDSIFYELLTFDDGEELLYAADNAINIKYSNSHNSDFPSYVADKIYGPLL